MLTKKMFWMVMATTVVLGLAGSVNATVPNSGYYTASVQCSPGSSEVGNCYMHTSKSCSESSISVSARSASMDYNEVGEAKAWGVVIYNFTWVPNPLNPNQTPPGGTLTWDMDSSASTISQGGVQTYGTGTLSAEASASASDNQGLFSVEIEANGSVTAGSSGSADIDGSVSNGTWTDSENEYEIGYVSGWLGQIIGDYAHTSGTQGAKSISSGTTSFSIAFVASVDAKSACTSHYVDIPNCSATAMANASFGAGFTMNDPE